MYDVSGKRALTANVSNGAAQLDISRLPNGIYTVVSIDENGNKVDTRKIVKQ